MRIEKLWLSKIRENSHNPNEMPRDMFDSLVATIRDHGYLQPILVRPAGDGYEIVDGAHRYRALKALGKRKALCIIVPADVKAAKLFTLSMNRLRGRLDNFKVAKLIGGMSPELTAKYLAYREKERREIQSLMSGIPKFKMPKIERPPMPLVMDFFLSRDDAARVREALDDN